MSNEPKITVNGQELTTAEAMTMRVALQSFAMSLDEFGLGDDTVGTSICSGYLKNIHSINKLMGLTS